MMNHPILRLRASLYRMRHILDLLLLWFVAGFAGFYWGTKLPWTDALLSAFYFEVQPGLMAQGYAFWGQSLLFGVFVGLLFKEGLENYTERCRLMSSLVKDHTIIVGYTHLGARLVAHCVKQKLPYVLIEIHKDLVDDLLRQGEPVIIDDARSKDALPAANIKAAKRLIIASNNIETALIVTKAAKEANPAIKVAARCGVDELVGVLEKLGADQVYSTSLAAFNEVVKVFD